jgi:hypothetical protein
LLNVIERGADWPSATVQAKAVFLAKEDKVSADPLDYRVLLILSAVYRRWAASRLHQLEEWTQAWREPEHYAGVSGKGAADAAYSQALLFEETIMQQLQMAGFTADI